MTVRSGAGNKLDGKVTVYEGEDGAGSMALEVCLAPEALARLVADDEFMAAVGATHCDFKAEYTLYSNKLSSAFV